MGIQINGQTDTVTATDGSINVGGDVTIPGVLTYEDVTNVDSVGIVTAQSGIHVTGGSVGIGTDNPSRNLTVASGSSSGYIQLCNNASGIGSTDGFHLKLDSQGLTADIINRENGPSFLDK